MTKSTELKQKLVFSFLFVGVLLIIFATLAATRQTQDNRGGAWTGCTCVDGKYLGDFCPPYLQQQVCEE